MAEQRRLQTKLVQICWHGQGVGNDGAIMAQDSREYICTTIYDHIQAQAELASWMKHGDWRSSFWEAHITFDLRHPILSHRLTQQYHVIILFVSFSTSSGLVFPFSLTLLHQTFTTITPLALFDIAFDIAELSEAADIYPHCDWPTSVSSEANCSLHLAYLAHNCARSLLDFWQHGPCSTRVLAFDNSVWQQIRTRSLSSSS